MGNRVWVVKEQEAKLYYDICKQASENEEVFSRFKISGEYTTILSHVDKQKGSLYLRQIEIHYPELLKDNRYLINDKLGGDEFDRSSRKFKENFGRGYSRHSQEYISADPSTFRYLKQVGDILSICNPTSVVEIGGGYGGLLLLLSQYCDINSYYDYDHPDVIKLVKKYLGNYNISVDDEVKDKYDLVISAFAWDELDVNVRKWYINNVFTKGEHGYIVASEKTISPHLEHIRKVIDKPVHTVQYLSENYIQLGIGSHLNITYW